VTKTPGSVRGLTDPKDQHNAERQRLPWPRGSPGNQLPGLASWWSASLLDGRSDLGRCGDIAVIWCAAEVKPGRADRVGALQGDPAAVSAARHRCDRAMCLQRVTSVYLGADGWWHGWVTVGTKDDGSPDRRHRKGRSEAEVARKVQELEPQRDTSRITKNS
jgi:hypothetical protein